MNNISHKIKQVRTHFKLNQTDFGRRVGVPLSTISKYEQGLVNPGYEFLSKIGQIYKINLNWLINDEGEMFEEEILLQRTGTDDRPYLRLIKNKNSFTVAPTSELKEADCKIAWNYQAFTDDKSIIKTAKEKKTQIIIDDISTGRTKIYNTDGTITEYDPHSPYQKLLKRIETEANNKKAITLLNSALDALKGYEEMILFRAKVDGMLYMMEDKSESTILN